MFEIGNSLREARYRQQLELSEVEQATKIRARYLQALEEETFDALPAQAYVKGFLRNYAEYLGLDGQLYVDEYNSRYAVGEEEPREPVVARRSSGVHARHRRTERRGVLLALVGIGIVFALVIAAWKFSGNNSTSIANLSTTTTTPTTKATTSTTKPKSKPRVVVPTRFAFFVVAVGGSCWMDVRNYSSSGRTLFTGTVDPGQYHRFLARRLWISFGDPGHVKASLNGRAVTIPGGGRPVAVRITRQGVSIAPPNG
ncbi:MAG TPA: RodZ domain-containing protein [Gaiellaceae bacterium]|nr:RodZ domain-containing protein [Gaiellaceae bacterium]